MARSTGAHRSAKRSGSRGVLDRGDVIWVSFNPQAGHEQAGRRPAVVLSPASYNNRSGLALVCPVTNQRKGYPFEVAIPDGLPVTGVILADQVKSVDWQAREVEPMCKVPVDTLAQIVAKLRPLLGED